MDRHFTVSIFVVHLNKVLLHLHKKAQIMLPLGGHVEPNELPEETCIRESKEESGMDIELYNPFNFELQKLCEIDNEMLLINPMYTIMGEISHQHHHIDFVYFATSQTDVTNPEDGESDCLRWYGKEELINGSNIQENTKMMALKALELLSWNHKMER